MKSIIAIWAAVVLSATQVFAQAASTPVVLTDTPHSYFVTSIKFSPDGTWFATAGDSTIKVWNARTGRLLRTITAHSERADRIDVSSVSNLIVSVSTLDQSIKVFRAETGDLVQTFKRRATTAEAAITKRYFGTPRYAVFTKNGREVVSLVDEELVRWDIATGKEIQAFRVDNFVRKGNVSSADLPVFFTMSQDEKLAFVGYGYYEQGSAISVFDMASGRRTRSFADKTNDAQVYGASPDKRLLVSGGKNGALKLWDIETGRLLQNFVGHGAEIISVAVSRSGRMIASTDKTGQLHFWSPTSSAPVRGSRPQMYINSEATFAPDGRTFVVPSSNERGRVGTVLFIDVETGATIKNLPRETRELAVAGTRGNDFVLADNQSVSTWNGETGQPQSLPQPLDQLFAKLGRDVVTDQAGRRLIPVLSNNPAQMTGGVWDLATASLRARFQWDQRDLVLMKDGAISPDGKKFALFVNKGARLGEDRTIGLFDIDSGLRLRTFGGFSSSIREVRFSDDGKKLFGFGGKTAIIFDIDTGIPLNELKSDKIRIMGTMSPGATSYIFAEWIPDQGRAKATELQKWDSETGRLIWASPIPGDPWITYIAVSADSRWAVSASLSTRIHLWNYENGQLVRELEGSQGLPTSIAFFNNNSRVAVATTNGTNSIWDTATGALLATTVSNGATEWITITPEGFFASSARGAELLHVSQGFEIFSIDQFYQSLSRPDLVREKLVGDPRGLVRDAAAQLELTKAIATGNAPDVRIASPATGGPVVNSQINAEVEFTDRGGGIGRVEWRVNGVTVGVETPPAPVAGQPLRLTRNLVLDAGSNTLEVVAYNSANLVASVPARATVTVPAAPTTPGQAAAPPSRLFVIAAGINDYTDSRFKLAGSVRDAQALSKAFGTNGDGLYKSVEVKLLTDAEVSKSTLDAAFADFAARATPSDVFLLFLAGHGKTVGGRYYFVPRDFALEQNANDKVINAAVIAQGIPQEQWQRWFALIPARRSMILFDTCESGTLTGDVAQTKALEQSAANDRLAQASGRSIITASSSSQAAFDSYRGHGLFTYNLLDALERADSDGNGTIEINELAAFVYAQVTTLSEQVFKTRQEPQIRIASSYPLTKQGRVLAGDLPALAQDAAPPFQLAQTADLQIKPSNGAAVVRSLTAKTAVSVLKSEGGWSLIASGGKPIGYVATKDLAPMR